MMLVRLECVGAIQISANKDSDLGRICLRRFTHRAERFTLILTFSLCLLRAQNNYFA
jgi:hypothetical protein